MGIEKLNIETINKSVIKIIKSKPLFEDYTFAENAIHKIKTPKVFTQYDFILNSIEKNRWILFRIEDYFNHQKIVIWINQLEEKKAVHIDLENYFFFEMKIKNIKQKLIFKATSSSALEEKLDKALDFILATSDYRLKEVFEGRFWVNMPFDWHGYK